MLGTLRFSVRYWLRAPRLVPSEPKTRVESLAPPCGTAVPRESCWEEWGSRAFLSSKNRQFTVIWLWFNNAFKGGSKWPIKSGDLFASVCFPGAPSELVPFTQPRPPRGNPQMTCCQCRSLIPTAHCSLHHPPLSFSVSVPLGLFPSHFPTFLFSLLSSFLNNECWMAMQISVSPENLSQGGSVSPIFMSFKWLLSKWGRTKSRPSCHKYKWLDIGCNKPSGKIIWCAVAVMVYHTGSSYISTGKVIRSFRGL